MWTVVWTNACVRASMQCSLYAPSKSKDVVVREHLCAWEKGEKMREAETEREGGECVYMYACMQHVCMDLNHLGTGE